MSKFNALGLALAVLVAAPALADSPPQAKPDDSQKVICHREVPIGSMFASRKTCKTKAQWQAFNAEEERVKRERLQEGTNRPQASD